MNTRVRIPEHVVPGKRLGRHVNHDPRSLAYQVQPQPARALASVLHERRVAVLDQGTTSSCTGNASVGAVGSLPLFPALPTDHPALDETYARDTVYALATQLDEYPGSYDPATGKGDDGSSGLAAAKACKQLGLIPGYLHATSLTAMQTALQDTPVIVGVNWYEGFDSPTSSGLITISGSVRGGHEFEVIGLDVTEKTFLAVNSWGPAYAVKGYFSFSFDTMDQLLHEQGDCTQLLPLSVPAPPTPTPAPGDADATLVAALDPWAAERHRGSNAQAVTAYKVWRAAQ